MVGDSRVIVVREFDPKTDRLGVEHVERSCDVGPSGKLSLFFDLMGDPICRVRNSPVYLMLVYMLSLPTHYYSIPTLFTYTPSHIHVPLDYLFFLLYLFLFVCKQ